MSEEHVVLFETELALPFTVSNLVGIEKGALLELVDPDTARAVTTKEAVCAGIAKTEKIASNGQTKLAILRGGHFKCTISGNVTVGNALITSGVTNPNRLEAAGVDAEDIVGIAMESGTDGQTIKYELGPRTINVA